MAREVLTERRGPGHRRLLRGHGDRPRGAGVRAKIVVLAASACETARLLLNSKSTRHPEGLANSSGAVGRYLTDTTGTGVQGHIPALESLPPYNEDGAGGMHVYMPWWLDNQKLDFPRGYHIEPWGGRDMPGYGFMSGIHAPRRRLRQEAQGRLPPALRLLRRLLRPRRDDPQQGLLLRDRPGRRSTSTGSPSCASTGSGRTCELNQAAPHERDGRRDHRGDGRQGGGQAARHATRTTASSSAARSSTRRAPRAWATSPRTSVLNEWCQAHDCKNLFVADSGPFVSNAHKNMTWTILALSMRTSEHIAEERGRGTSDGNEIGRRSALRLIGAAPLAVGFTLGATRPRRPREKAATAVKAAAAGKPYMPKFFNRPRMEDGARPGGHDHPEGRALGQRHRRRGAGVHGLPHERPDRHRPPARAAPDGHARRPGLDRLACPSAVSASAFAEATEAERTAILDEIAYSARTSRRTRRRCASRATCA